jgi:hypothetical protein
VNARVMTLFPAPHRPTHPPTSHSCPFPDIGEKLPIWTALAPKVNAAAIPRASAMPPAATIGTESLSAKLVRSLCFFNAKALRGCMMKCSRYVGARATSLRTVVNEPDRISTVLLLVESGIGASIVAGSVRHLIRAAGTVLLCRLQPYPRRSSCD